MTIDFAQLSEVVRGFSRRFPEGDDPFRMLTRLLEECGELAQQVNHFEGSGVKREKHGEPDRAKLAHEISDVLTCVARVIDHYHVEAEVVADLDWIYQRLQSEGFITGDR
ncbi:MAG TPA: MazG nucleotide pyrophosphohydrolase domain-containing protein [Anaerolineae bacterium]|nr:MazG nucleotide pyrophosphohydrolase domain-containing protein [Anaerolineae bacterium]